MKRIRIKQIPTERGNYNLFGIYTGFGPFDCHYIARKLHSILNIIPKKALAVTYAPNNDPFEQSTNEDQSRYVFLDFIWIEDESTIRQILARGNNLSITISTTEEWEITLQDPSQNLMRHSHSSMTMYFSETEEYWTMANEMPFDGGDNDPVMGYHDANIAVCPHTFVLNNN